MINRQWLFGLLAATVAAAILFAALPGLDLATARLFHDDAGFIGQRGLGPAARTLFYWLPAGAMLVAIGLFVARRVGASVAAPSGRALLFLATSFAVGPGLLANVVLKDHSHRPRPAQVEAFGGASPYRPFWTFDGACARNCSFVSGEASAAFWLTAPASLAPPPWRAPAIAVALGVGVATGVLRMAFGGHFASDIVFAALFTMLVVVGLRRLWRGSGG